MQIVPFRETRSLVNRKTPNRRSQMLMLQRGGKDVEVGSIVDKATTWNANMLNPLIGQEQQMQVAAQGGE